MVNKLLLFASLIIVLSSCRKKVECYQCITHRYNEMIDTNYVTDKTLCDVTLEDVAQYENENTGRKIVFITWEGTLYRGMDTYERHSTKCTIKD